MAATVFARQRASGLDRCAYSGGPAPEVRGRLLVLIADLRWLGRLACRSPETRRAGRPVRVLRLWSVPRCARLHSARAGAFDAVGDGNPVPVRAGCPRLERTAPGRAECPPPASEMRSPWPPGRCSIRTGPARPRRVTVRESGWIMWDALGAHPRKRSISDKPDLFLVHLTGARGSEFV